MKRRPNQTLLASLPLRRALRTTIVVLLALIFSHYYSRTHTFWLTIVAALLTQTELGFPIHQGLQRFFWIILLFFAGGQLALWAHTPWVLPLAVLCAATLTAYRYAYCASRYSGLHFSLFILIILLLTLIFPAPLLSTAYLLDILMGAALGLSATVLLFRDQPDLEFPKRMVPLLQDLSEYLGALTALLLGEENAAQLAQHKRDALEKRWAHKDQAFPLWVFEPGFNPALKPGQYYFAVHVGQVTEILFALNHYARHPFPQDLLNQFNFTLRDSTRRSQELLSHLTLLLEGRTPRFTETDFISDLPALDEAFQSKIQLSLELLDLSRDYIYMAAFIRYLKDLRLQLLKLASTLS